MPAPASSTSDPTWLYRGNNRGLLHPKHPGMCCQMKLWKESRGYLCVERNTEHCSFVNSTQCHLVTLKSSESMAPGLKKAFSFSELVRLCAVVWASFQFSFVDLAVLGLEISFFLSVGRNAFLTRACWCKWDGMARVGFPQDTEACVAHKHLKICSAWGLTKWWNKMNTSTHGAGPPPFLPLYPGGGFILRPIPGLCGQGSGHTFSKVFWWTFFFSWGEMSREVVGSGGLMLPVLLSTVPSHLCCSGHCVSPLCSIPWVLNLMRQNVLGSWNIESRRMRQPDGREAQSLRDFQEGKRKGFYYDIAINNRQFIT